MSVCLFLSLSNSHTHILSLYLSLSRSSSLSLPLCPSPSLSQPPPPSTSLPHLSLFLIMQLTWLAGCVRSQAGPSLIFSDFPSGVLPSGTEEGNQMSTRPGGTLSVLDRTRSTLALSSSIIKYLLWPRPSQLLSCWVSFSSFLFFSTFCFRALRFKKKQQKKKTLYFAVKNNYNCTALLSSLKLGYELYCLFA